MIGKGHQGAALVTLDEHKFKLRLTFPVSNKTAELVTDSIITLLSGFKRLVHTLTFDNARSSPYMNRLPKRLIATSISPKGW